MKMVIRGMVYDIAIPTLWGNIRKPMVSQAHWGFLCRVSLASAAGGRSQETMPKMPGVTWYTSAEGLVFLSGGYHWRAGRFWFLRWSTRVGFKHLFGWKKRFIIFSIKLLYFSCLGKTAFLYFGKLFLARPRMFQHSNFKDSHRPADRVWRGVRLCMVRRWDEDGGSLRAANPQTLDE